MYYKRHISKFKTKISKIPGKPKSKDEKKV